MPRHSAAVYRRRRIVVFSGLLVLIAALAAGIWLVIAQPWSGAPTPKDTSSASAPQNTEEPDGEDGGSPTPETEEPPGIVACEAADVEVRAVTDAESYASDQLPKMSIDLQNRTDRDCTINVGSSTQTFTITSGADVWWRSTDCQSEPADLIVTLEAGSTVSSLTPVEWDRTRSQPETCEDPNRPRAPGGGASYHVQVSIGGFESTQTKQIFLQ